MDLSLGDGTAKIVLNTKGTMDDISPEMKRLLNYIDGQEPEDDFTRELAEAVESVRKNKRWRLDYMTLQMHYDEKYEEGLERGLEWGREQGINWGEVRKLVSMVCKKLKRGYIAEKIAEWLEEDLEIIQNICVVAREFAPEYNVEKICAKIMGSEPTP
ncbi:MAG: hypothetical protein NC307_08645 [Roseburia sp.]|nr:hypothetical protein [Roseburia sp.]